ncbi:MAG: CRISPR-associated endonuclease Cas2 [Chloroflexi bacterium]|nr:CRISPR-associated endonuclease Cas2 [Chloroflexota bacterium]
MRVVISYDISDDKCRRTIAKKLEGYGYRVQYSVFECDVTAKQLKKLKRELNPSVQTKRGDSIRFYPLSADAVEKILILGNDYARTLGLLAVI